MKTEQATPTALVAPVRGRYTVHGRQSQLGVLKAVLSAPRLLLIDAPQGPDGVLLIPFEAIEQIKVDERTILVRPAREVLRRAGVLSTSRRDGG